MRFEPSVQGVMCLRLSTGIRGRDVAEKSLHPADEACIPQLLTARDGLAILGAPNGHL